MAILLDNIVTHSMSGWTSGQWSHTIGAGTDILTVLVNVGDTANGLPWSASAVLCDSTPLTKFGTSGTPESGSPVRGTEVWYLVNPGTGTKTISASAAAASTFYGQIISETFTGVNQANPFSGSVIISGGFTSNDSAVITLNAVNGDVVHAFTPYFNNPTSITSTGSFTTIWHDRNTPENSDYFGIGLTQTSAGGSNEVSLSFSTVTPINLAAIVLQAETAVSSSDILIMWISEETYTLVAVSSSQPPTGSDSGSGFFVSTTGNNTNLGTLASPWDINHALTGASGSISGTVWVREGTYTQAIFDIKTSGSSDNDPVIWRNYNNEHVQLIGNDPSEWTCLLRGDYLWVWGLDMSSNVQPAGDSSNIVLSGYHTKLINNYIHDGQSVGVVSQQVLGTEVYGNIVNYNGRQQTASEGPGYGVYAQNVIASIEPKYFTDNIIAYNWSWGLHFYTEGATNDYIVAEGNAVYNSGKFWKSSSWAPSFLFEGPSGSNGAGNQNFHCSGNVMYLGPGSGSGGHYFGLFGQPITKMTASVNYFVAMGGGVAFSFDADGGSNILSGNIIAGTTSPGNLDVTYPSNTYVTTSAALQARGLEYRVRKNKYESKRANIYVMNWPTASTVDINPNINETVLQNGDYYVIKDGLNYWGNAVTSGTFNGGTITIPMTGLQAATFTTGSPITGQETFATNRPTHTAPEFATFILSGS